MDTLINTVNSIRNYGTLPFPSVMQFEMTSYCPLSCPQCYKEESPENEMSLECFEKYFNECRTKGTVKIILNGGEVALYSRFKDLMTIINSDPELYVNCYTSGLNLQNSFLQYWDFTNSRKRLFISLNGSTEAVNKISRDGYTYSMEAIKTLASNNVKYGINWVLRNDNIEDFKNILDICEQYHVSWLFITRNKLSGMRTDHAEDCTTQQIREFLEIYIQKKEQRNFEVITESCFPEMRLYKEGDSEQLNFYNGCGANKFLCCITWDGRITPCTHLYYPTISETIEEYWDKAIKNKPYKKKRSGCLGCEWIRSCNDCRVGTEWKIDGKDKCWFWVKK